MGDLQRISRRAFVIGSAAVAGGIAFGSYSDAGQPAATANGNPLADGLGPNSVTFNPWVEISPEKITLIAQHADIGQGVGSVQPIMIAEEMDLEPGQFEIRFAGPSTLTPASQTSLRRSWPRTKARPPKRRAPPRSNPSGSPACR